MTTETFFVSDLHKFARRSRAHVYDEEIYRAARQANYFVLGGDIFDFKWSTLGSIERTADVAAVWIAELAVSHPHCSFQFLLGNHDSNAHFVDQLERLEVEHDNFRWHRYYCREGACLFLHGDILDCEPCHNRLDEHRRAWDREHGLGRSSHLAYDVIVGARLHRLAAVMLQRRTRTLGRMVEYLKVIGHGPDNGLRNVYFGHTHRELREVEFGGLVFHNGGAAVRGNDFRIIRIDREELLSNSGSDSRISSDENDGH